ncbi:WD40 repeat-containing protein HOS15-like isoform X2 [Wolffia australiana]
MEPQSITSSELNFLVFRYLQESGFTHSAFALGYEAGIDKSVIDGHSIPPGALVTFVQKGLRYVELEANLGANDADGDDDFSFLQPSDLITKGVNELRDLIKDRKDNFHKAKDNDQEKAKESALIKDREHRQEREREVSEKGKDNGKKDKGKEKTEEKGDQQKEKPEQHPEKELSKDREDKIIITSDVAVPHGPESMDICAEAAVSSVEVASSDVTILEGHTSEVFSCAWSPVGSLLASGSGDSTARIWAIPSGHCGLGLRNGPPNVVVLKHFKGKTNEKSKDVTTLDWNFDGTLLATGSYDGNARIWSREGEVKGTLSKHKGPIFSLKWNRKGDFLVSGSVDKTAIVWDVKTGEPRQQFDFHSAPTLDVDWRNNVSFASCSTDNMIYFCKVGETRPLKSFIGHQGEVNAIKWDPTGTLLASCSDDMTAKIWSLKQDKCVYDFKDHQKEIYTIRWSPTGPGSINPNQQLILASASVDSTVKLWDVEAGKLLRTLSGHRAAVYTISFSPNGELVASGSVDQSLNVWSVKEGRLVRTYRAGGGGIFEVCWNGEGDKIAASFANSTVCVLDFRL